MENLKGEFVIKYEEDHAVIILPGEVIISNIAELKEKLQSLCDQGFYMVYLDCRNLKMFDTSAIVSVGSFNHTFKEKGGQIRFINLQSDYIKYLFRTIALYKIIEIEGMEEAK